MRGRREILSYGIIRIIIPAFFLAALNFCTKEPTAPEVFNVMLRTAQDQVIEYGGNITVEMKVMTGFDVREGIKIKFEIISGAGSFSSNESTTDFNGMATTVWTPGKESFSQLISATAYNGQGEAIATRQLRAFCYVPGIWNKIPMSVNKYVSTIGDMVVDEENGFTLAAGYNYNLLMQGDRYYKWTTVNPSLLWGINNVEIDTKGVVYVTSFANQGRADIFRSRDHGITWSQCTRPFETAPYDYSITLCNDNSLWASSWGQTFRVSRDEGESWEEISQMYSYGNLEVASFRDGTLLVNSSQEPLKMSEDGGKTWKEIVTPKDLIHLYITDNDLVVIATLGRGFELYTSDDRCKTFKLVGIYSNQGFGSDKHFITKRNGLYYISIPRFGVLETPDFRHMTYYTNTDMYDFFIDHKGVMMMRSNSDFGSMYVYEPPEQD